MKVRFRNFQNMMEAPFIIYFDIESICLPLVEGDTNSKTKREGKHMPISVWALRVCRPNPQYSSIKPFLYMGTDSISEFLKYLEHQVGDIAHILSSVEAPIVMSDSDEALYQGVMHCRMCNSPFDDEETIKCRDHCHLSGQYCQPLCNKCNLTYGSSQCYKINVIMHGLSNYDSHFIVQELHRYKSSCINVIPKSSEQFLMFSIGDAHFKDSYHFLGASLMTLVSNLREKGKKYFTNINHYMPLKELNSLLKCKGVLPYSYLNSVKHLSETSLPGRGSFFNELSLKEISKEEYAFVHRVWSTFLCATLKDYMVVYLLSDVLLLANVFENFRGNCLESYELDPLHYFTSAHFTFDAFFVKVQSKS